MAVVASVLVPVHDAAAFLDGAVGSALAQTCADLEVIAIDDGSTDDSHAALLGWAARDSRVIVLRHATCRGVAAARNTAIERATGRWLVPLDADDAMLPDRVDRLVAVAEAVGAEAAGADLLADGLRARDFATGADLGEVFPTAEMTLAEPVTLAEMIRRDRPNEAGFAKFGYLKPVIRRDFLQRSGIRYREGLRVGEDLLFYFDCVAGGARFHLTPGAGYVYSVRAGSASAVGAPSLSLVNHAMLRIAEQIGDRALIALLRQRQRGIDSDGFDLAIGARRPLDAWRYARHASPARMASRLWAAAGATWRGVASRLLPGR